MSFALYLLLDVRIKLPRWTQLHKKLLIPHERTIDFFSHNCIAELKSHSAEILGVRFDIWFQNMIIESSELNGYKIQVNWGRDRYKIHSWSHWNENIRIEQENEQQTELVLAYPICKLVSGKNLRSSLPLPHRSSSASRSSLLQRSIQNQNLSTQNKQSQKIYATTSNRLKGSPSLVVCGSANPHYNP